MASGFGKCFSIKRIFQEKRW